MWEVKSEPVGSTPHHELAAPLPLDRSVVRDLAFSPDGQLLATVDSWHIILWSLADPRHPTRLGTVDASVGSAIVVADEGRTLLFSGADTRVWDLRNLRDVRRTAVQHAFVIAGGGLTSEEWTRHVSGLAYVDTCAR